LADQNFRVKNGLEVGLGATVLVATNAGRIGIKTTDPQSALDVRGSISIGRSDAAGINSIRSVVDINSWEYGGAFKLVSGEETSPQDIFFKDDGTKMYILGDTGNDVNEYELSTPWEVSSAGFTTNFSVAAQDTNPAGLYFKPDGTRMYICGTTGVSPLTGDRVYSYTLSTPWSLVGVTTDTVAGAGTTFKNFNSGANDTIPGGVYFKDDGTKMYVVGATGDAVYEYTVSTAWEIDSTVTLNYTLLIGATNTQNLPLTLVVPVGINFNTTGTKMYITDSTRDVVSRFDLTTPWDLSTATFFDNVYVGFQELTPNGIFYQEDQSKAYIVGSSADTVFQYNTDVPSLELASSGISTRSSIILNNEARLNNRLYVTNDAHFSSPVTLKQTLQVDGSVTTNSNLTVSGGTITAGNVTASLLTGNTSTTISFGTQLTSGGLVVGGTNQTGTMTIDRSTQTHTLDIASAVSGSGNQKTINLGTGGASGSRTLITVGSATAGAISTVTIPSPTNLLIGTATTTGTASQPLQVSGGAYVSGNLGVGVTNPTVSLDVIGDAKFTGVVTATTFIGDLTGTATTATNLSDAANITTGTISDNRLPDLITSNINITSGVSTFLTVKATTFEGSLTGNASSATYASTAGVSTALQNSRTFEITGDVVASAISFDGTGNVSLAATIQPNSVALGTDTTGDYVQSISGTSNQITVTSGTGEGSTPTLSIPSQFTAPQDVTVTRDLQVNRNLNVTGNITIGGTTSTIFSSTLNIYDPDIVLGVRTDGSGNDVSNDNTANHGGIAIASTEGTPLISLYDVGVGETNPATYKKFMWFKSGTFSGLGTDAWLSNYAIGIGSTQVPNGVRLAAGSVQFTERDLSVVRNINSSGVVTATTFIGALTGTATSTTNIPNLSGDVSSNNTVTTLATVNSNVGTYGGTGAIPVVTVNAKGLVTGVSTVAPNNGTLTLAVSGTGLSGSASFTANQSGNSTFTVTSNATSANTVSTIVARDVSGNFNAGIITATLSGTATTATNLANAANITTGTINSARLSGTYTIDINGNSTTSGYATTAGIASALTESASVNTTGIITASSFVKSGGTSSQFLKADGSVDSSTYLTSYTETDTLDTVTNRGNTTTNGISVGVLTATSGNFSGIITSSGAVISGVVTTNGFNATTGNDYKINGTSVLNATTLGSGVVNSSLTSVGTLGQLNVSGVVTAVTFNGQINAGVGTITTLSGTTATYTTGNFTTGNIVTGVVTTLTSTNATLTNINSSGISTLGVTSTTNLTTQQFNVSGISTFQSSNLKIRNPANTFEYSIVGSAIAANRNLTLPLITSDDTVATLGTNQTFSGIQTFSGTLSAIGSISLTGSATGSLFFGTTQTTAVILIGGTGGTGTISLGRSLVSQQTDIQAGASGIGTSKTINFGTGGLSGSFTRINIGPTAGVGTVLVNTGTNLGIGSAIPTVSLDVIGDAKFTGVITSTDYNSASDINLKTNIEKIKNPLDKVIQISGVNFTWKGNGKKSMGVIAQEVEKVLPELVNGEDTKTVNYNGLIGLLIECVKEQQKEIELLKEFLNK
jgi:hypothetical protein